MAMKAVSMIMHLKTTHIELVSQVVRYIRSVAELTCN